MLHNVQQQQQQQHLKFDKNYTAKGKERKSKIQARHKTILKSQRLFKVKPGNK